MSERYQRWLLSGGIGSGKSTVRALFEAQGVETVDSDSIGHDVLKPGGAAVDTVSERWPGVLIDGVIDRAALAEIVFNSPEELVELENMTHPLIFEEVTARANRAEGDLVIEIPILRSSVVDGAQVMIVDAPDPVRIERAIRRGHSEKDVRARLAAQPTRGEWLATADLVIPNPGTLEELEASVGRLTLLLFGRG